MTPDLNHPLEQGFARLRPIEQADLPRWLAWLQSDPVRRGISWRPHSTQELLGFVDSTHLQGTAGEVRFAIARSTDGAMLGSVGFHSICLPHRSAEVAYDLDPDHWGKGLATAVCRSAIAWARQQGFVRIQAKVFPENAASIRVLEHSGFEREGHLRQFRWVDGEARDMLIYGNVPG